jgi:RNA polymerase sigma-70 factor (ECF subfamily)
VQDERVDVKPGSDLEVLYRALAGRVWRALLAYAGDPEVASDAVAEAFAQCLRRGDAVRAPERWIWRTAFRIAAGELKRRGTRQDPVPDTPYEVGEGAADLLRALSVLPPKQRAALVLHYYGGYTAKETADLIDSSSATVRVHLSQGRKRLRRILEDPDG